MLHGFKAMPFQGFSHSQSGNILKALLGFALMSALPQSAPLTDTVGGVFFPSCSTCAWLSDTSECVTLLPLLKRNNSHCDKGSHDVALGDPPYVQAGRSSLYFTQEQRSGFIAGPNTPDYDGNIIFFLFCVFI